MSVWGGILFCVGLIVIAIVAVRKWLRNQQPAVPQVPPKKYYVGDTVKNSQMGYEITVTNFFDTQEIMRRHSSITTENNFLVVNLTITNTGIRRILIERDAMKIMLGQARYCKHSASSYLENGEEGDITVDPGLTKKFAVAFEIPTKSEEGNCILGFSEINNTFYSDENIKIILSKKTTTD